MITHSPFALTTATAPTQTQPSFAADWFVSGIARLNDEDFVSIKSRDLSTQFSLIGRAENRQYGVALASVNWSDAVGKTTVILSKGTETARLEFNEADVRNPPQAAIAQRSGGTAKATVIPAPAHLASNSALPSPPEIRKRQLPIPVPR